MWNGTLNVLEHSRPKAVCRLRILKPAEETIPLLSATKHITVKDYLRGVQLNGPVLGTCTLPPHVGQTNYIQFVQYLRHGNDGKQPEKCAVTDVMLPSGYVLVLVVDPSHSGYIDGDTRLLVKQIRVASPKRVLPESVQAVVAKAPAAAVPVVAAASAPQDMGPGTEKLLLFSGLVNSPSMQAQLRVCDADDTLPISGVCVYRLLELGVPVAARVPGAGIHVLDCTVGGAGVLALHAAQQEGVSVTAVRGCSTEADCIAHNARLVLSPREAARLVLAERPDALVGGSTRIVVYVCPEAVGSGTDDECIQFMRNAVSAGRSCVLCSRRPLVQLADVLEARFGNAVEVTGPVQLGRIQALLMRASEGTQCPGHVAKAGRIV
jgi:hypothetical protein